jgi:anti-sigma28 factor (negative regulator of flagellin synthesis)
MKINNTGSITPDASANAARVQRDAVTGSPPVRDGAEPETAALDSVELSAEGQALAKASALSPERAEEIRQNILKGAYDAAAVVDQVARRILQSRDL